jgi:hypothetical protein
MKGFAVVESCEDYEQTLVLRTGREMPTGGILDWADNRAREPRAIFESRVAAREAIDRTEHYRLAFGRTDLPERKLCGVVPVQFVAS